MKTTYEVHGANNQFPVNLVFTGKGACVSVKPGTYTATALVRAINRRIKELPEPAGRYTYDADNKAFTYHPAIPRMRLIAKSKKAKS